MLIFKFNSNVKPLGIGNVNFFFLGCGDKFGNSNLQGYYTILYISGNCLTGITFIVINSDTFERT